MEPQEVKVNLSVAAAIEENASAVDGDAEDNTTTVDCSSDDKARAGAQMMVKSTGVGAVGGLQVAIKAKRIRCRPGKKKKQERRMSAGQGVRGAGGAVGAAIGGVAQQRKRRRGKTKGNRKGGVGAGAGNPRERKSVNWRLPDQDLAIPPYPLVPYNTNRFLMEYHMAEVPTGTSTPVGRDEFLTNEFTTVYETAKCERLEALPKQQLIQEYLQLESSHEQLKQRVKSEEAASGNSNANGSKSAGGSHHSSSSYNRAKWESHWRALKDQVRRLTAENNELKQELMLSKGGGEAKPQGREVDDSLDSESDSSVSSISSRSSSRSSSSSCSSSSKSASGSGSCCSSRCSSRDSQGNVRPSRMNSDAEMVANDDLEDVAMRSEGGGGQPENESNGERPAQNHHRHRTHRQRRNSRLQQQGQSVENGHMEDEAQV